jgi:O-antigen/teichoic acid export membrane protein
MKGLLSLLSINVSGKVVSIFVFAFLARALDAEHLAYIGVIPALSGFLLVALSFGVPTLLERDFPQLRVREPERADAMMRAAYLIVFCSLVFMFALLFPFTGAWMPLVLGGYDVDPETVRWITLPLATYMFLEMNGSMLITRNEATRFGIVRVYGDLAAKAGALLFYLSNPSELSVFLGLAAGQLPFCLALFWLNRRWLFRREMASPFALIASSGVFYAESVFQMLRSRGDVLLVSSILGPVAVAGYYVAKTVASQLTVLFQPVTSIIIPAFSARYALGPQELSAVFRKVWSIAPPVFVWLASMLAAVSPFLIAVIAGEGYAGTWKTTLILCYVTAAMSIYMIACRVLLIMGSSMERFRVVLLHAALLAGLMLAVRDRFGAEGVAASWLAAAIVTVLVVRLRAGRIGFDWPESTALWRAILLSVPVPLVSLYVIGYGSHPDWLFLLQTGALGLLSLIGLLLLQGPFEEKQMIAAIPRPIAPAYRLIRRFATHD